MELGSFFGALPVHNGQCFHVFVFFVLTWVMLEIQFESFFFFKGLWRSATDTSQDLLARLAIVHMVHEAR